MNPQPGLLTYAPRTRAPPQVRAAWRPELHRFAPMLDGGTGLEHLRVEFPHSPYPAHLMVGPERGSEGTGAG